jgi:glutamate 5-kinase
MVLQNRSDIATAKRVVVKVGSSSISGKNAAKIANLVAALATAHKSGQEVILVTSGAIATAIPLFGLETRPDDLTTSQALASIGQGRLIARYQESLERYDIIAGQVLLTAQDLEGEETSTNAKSAMQRLLELRAIPIVNENDTVATAEIRFGDNDRLAALVAVLVEADALILLSDVDALYNKPPSEPGAVRLDEVRFGEDLSQFDIAGSGSSVGTGGAITKVAAAEIATAAGVSVLLTSADLVAEALSGAAVGTWFEAKG